MSDGLPNSPIVPHLGPLKAAPRAARLNRTELEFNTWSHVVAPGVDWRQTLSREYWILNYDRLRSGDSIIVHSFDHRIQFVARVLAINAAVDPVHLDMIFQPIHPTDLDLPLLPPQRQPRYEIRQAAGSPPFDTIDRSTGQRVRDNPTHRSGALELAASLERAALQVEAELAAAEATAGAFHLAEVVRVVESRPKPSHSTRPRGRPRKAKRAAKKAQKPADRPAA